MSWLDALGWAGSALLVFSLLQARVLRFRVLNLAACLILIVFNALLGVWPMAAMNVVLAAINIWFVVQLVRHRHDSATYQVVEVAGDDAWLQHLLLTHAEDIRRFQPDFDAAATDGRAAFLVARGDEAVGMVMVRDAGDGIGQVELDYVTPRFRDFTPGEFVFGSSGLFRDLGFRKVLTPPGMVEPYYDRLGLAREGGSYVLTVS